MSFTSANLHSLFSLALKHDTSDIHLRSEESPTLRIRGEMHPVQSKSLSKSDIFEIVKLVTDDSNINPNIFEIDGSYSVKDLCRVRYNIFSYDDKLGIIFRIIKTEIPSLKSLHMPNAISEISLFRRGLILVTGATGSGKSTTLASMIDHINSTEKKHIITVEDPVEFVHTQKESRITQREIGTNTPDFSSALRSSLRQDPDIIMVGEMRDTETISTALKAAETGHVVFSTMHTTDAISTIGRIISMFPPGEQETIRKRLAVNLKATIGQRLLKKKSGNGVLVAQEIMITTKGVQECIEGTEPLERIHSVILDDSGKSGRGMQTFDQHIMKLLKANRISEETALANVTNESDFLQNLDFE